MPPVFAHGALRLYLLALLESGPKHGYELIKALSERFGGTYSPSAGTIYPRLGKLEEEGLVATHTEGNHFTLNVAPDVSALGDLKGKSIGVTAVGSTTWIFARMVAKQQGWDADRDVKIVALGGLDAQLAALARKEIHAFVWGDGGAVTQLAGKSKILMRLDKVTTRWISQIQYTSEDAIRKQGDDIRKVMRGVFAAIRFMNDQTAEAAEIVAKKIGWSAEAVQAAHKVSGSLMSHDGTMSLEALRSMQDTVLEHGVIKKRLPVEEHVAREFTPVKV